MCLNQTKIFYKRRKQFLAINEWIFSIYEMLEYEYKFEGGELHEVSKNLPKRRIS